MDIQTNTKKSKFFSDFFQKFDFFSFQYSFRINDKNAYKSLFGGVLFIFYFLCSIIYFCYSFSQFWNGRNYSINYSITAADKQSGINLKNTNFTFYFSNSFPFIQDYIYTEVMYFNKNITNVIRTRTCSLEDFSSKKIDKDTFYKMGFQNLRCIDFNSENLELSGEDSDRKYLLIQMYVNKDINSKFESYFTSQNIYNNPFYLYWFDSIVDVRKYDDSVQNIINVEKIYLEANKTQILNTSISRIEFSSDNYIFYNYPIRQNLSFVDKISKYSYFSLKKYSSDSVDKCLVRIYLNFSRMMTTIDRRYKKLDQFLAEFGSINSNLLLILSIFAKFLNEFWAEQKLINKIIKFREYLKVNYPNSINLLKQNFKKMDKDSQNSFDFKDIPQNKFKKSSFKCLKEEKLDNIQEPYKDKPSLFSLEMSEKKSKTSPLEINIESEQRISTIHDMTTNIPDDKLIRSEKLLKDLRKPILFNCCEVIFRQCSCKSTNLHLKNILYQKALKKMNNYLDIITYAKKIQEIDILKYLILDKNQVQTLNFLTMPNISLKLSD